MTAAPEAHTAQVTVESMRIARRSEESARCFALISFPVGRNIDLVGVLATQLKNELGVTFNEIQARLPAGPRDSKEANIQDSNAGLPPEDEETEMIVNGEPAKVRRPRSSRNGNGAHADQSAYPFHSFVESEDHPGLCKTCNRRPDDNVHAEEAARPQSHPFVSHPGSNMCATCHLAEDNPLHVVEANPEPGEGDVLPGAAQKLIDDAARDEAEALAAEAERA